MDQKVSYLKKSKAKYRIKAFKRLKPLTYYDYFDFYKRETEDINCETVLKEQVNAVMVYAFVPAAAVT